MLILWISKQTYAEKNGVMMLSDERDMFSAETYFRNRDEFCAKALTCGLNLLKHLKDLRPVDTNYDEENDVLYVGLKDRNNSYGDDIDDLIVLRDMDTDEITGFTILDFSEKIK